MFLMNQKNQNLQMSNRMILKNRMFLKIQNLHRFHQMFLRIQNLRMLILRIQMYQMNPQIQKILHYLHFQMNL